MSRIIVKNLPAKCSEELVKQMFSSHGEVTDIKLMKTRQGTFRKFGFIGFKKEEHACAAIKHFNKTYIGSCKIEVEPAKPYGDQNLARPWSKYSSGSSSHKQRQGDTEEKKEKAEEEDVKKTQVSQLLEDYENLEDDPSFQEFLDVHKHKEKVKTWSDNTVVSEKKGYDKGKSLSKSVKGEDNLDESYSDEESREEVEDGGEGRREDAAVATGTSDLDYLKTKMVGLDSHNTSLKSCDIDSLSSSEGEDNDHLEASAVDHEESTLATTPYTVKMLGLPFNAKQRDIEVFFHPLHVVAVRFTQDDQGRPSGRGYADFHSEKDLKEALKRNKDCIRHRYIELFRDDSSHRKQEEVKEDINMKPWELKAALAGSSEVESIMESGRIFVRNLPFSTLEDDLSKLFGEYGPLTETTIPLDKTTNKPTGMGFVMFMLPEHAAKAFQALDGQIFQGRLLHLLPARPKTAPPLTSVISHQQHSSYKKKKEVKMKSEAGGGHNWNSLFLGANAVLNVMAEKYGTDKSVILDPEGPGESAAVRMALGETELVSETREFLLQHGVNLEAFEQERPKRSKTVIIVKNLPSSTKDAEICMLFQSFGQLVKVILPPAGISAMVEFAEPSHARQAFSKLAYTSFKHLPLYLEWAPINALVGDSVSEKKAETESKERETEDEGVDANTGTVFVKNLNFATGEDSLCKLFSEVGEVKSVTIARKRNSKDLSSPLSMGYGFVEYKSKKTAMEALKTHQKKMLDGHALELKFSHHINKSANSRASKKTSTKKQPKSCKILVRNVPFEASSKEVRDLFCTFGALKSVRLPKKLLGSAGTSGEHRGFGFVEFVSKEDALNAFKSLSHSTHLYGRRLVLEWAEQEESLEAIRKRTAEHFHGYTLPFSKRNKGQQQSLLDTLENSR